MPIPFRPIARLLTRTLHPPPQVDFTAVEKLQPNLERMDIDRGLLVTVNHYSSPDFRAWWLAILISANIPANIHWVVTSGWTNSGWLTGFTHWLFPLGARLLGFTSMPAMPPDPTETEQRAAAVRHALQYTRQTTRPVIGMAPEGNDSPGGVLGTLPAGVGRFMLLLSQHCPQILPVGVWTEGGIIHLKFGKPYPLELPEGLSTGGRDRLAGDTIMQHIALCLPEQLRGIYG